MAPSTVFVSLENWDEIWRRNQFLCSGWVRRDPNTRILFVAPPIDISYALRSRTMANALRQPRLWTVEQGAIAVIRPLKFWPNSWRWGRKLNEAFHRFMVRRASARLGFQSPLLWINDHAAGHLVGSMGECGVVYDVTDDWTCLTQASAARARVVAQDLELCRRADAVIVCSEHLKEMKRHLARSVTLIPNGVDTAHYAPPRVVSDAVARETERWVHPVLGYTGTVHPDRVDVNLVEAIALRMPEATLALVGPVMLEPSDLQRLGRMANIRIVGAQPYASMPEWMQAFDACIVPHVCSAFTESLNPIKLWEYFAVGKPIISTPVAGFRDYPKLVYLAKDAEGFAAAHAKASLEDPILAVQRRAVAQANSWTCRIDAVEACLSAIRLRAPHDRT